jgi:GntR family transcriptional regulator/MocR family aminotransferase
LAAGRAPIRWSRTRGRRWRSSRNYGPVSSSTSPSDPAGLHLAVGLVETRDDAVSAAAEALDLVARPLSAYYRNPATAAQGLVLGFGGTATENIDEAVTRLAQAIEFARLRLSA